MNLPIHAGTVVCPMHGGSTEVERCPTCQAYHGLGRANASLICLPAAGSEEREAEPPGESPKRSEPAPG